MSIIANRHKNFVTVNKEIVNKDTTFKISDWESLNILKISSTGENSGK